MADDKKIPCVKVMRPDTHGQQSYIQPISEFAFIADGEFDGAKPGDRIVLEYREPTQAELDALLEFTGW